MWTKNMTATTMSMLMLVSGILMPAMVFSVVLMLLVLVSMLAVMPMCGDVHDGVDADAAVC
jgi:hypothetical protein